MRLACPPKTGKRGACPTTSQQPNLLAILSAAAVRCEIHGGGFFLPRVRCSSQNPTWPLRATPPRARVARKISATATERRLPRRLKLRVRRKGKSVSDRELGAHRARHDHRHQSWPEHDRTLLRRIHRPAMRKSR